MKGFLALLRLQLLSRFADLKPRNLRAQLQEKKGKTVGMIFAYIFLLLYLGGFLVFLETTLLDQVLLPMGMPDMLLTMAVTLAMISTLIMAFFFIMSSLYFGRDAAFVASLPVSPRTVLSAKLAQVWCSETLIGAVFIWPACILYGLKVGGVGALFYVRALIVWLLVAVLPIAVVAFLSTLLIRLSALWKRRELVATVSGIALLIAYMFLCMNIGSITGSEDSGEMIQAFFTSYQGRIEAVSRFFPPAGWAAKGLAGDWGQLALFAAACLLAAGVTVWLLGYVYQKLSLLQTETPSVSHKGGAKGASFASSSAFKACVKREIKQVLRVPAYATNILPISLMPALMVAMMGISFNRAGGGESGETLDALLGGLNPAVVLAVLSAVMAFMAGMNNFLSTAVTREGRGHQFLCALPMGGRTPVLAKMAVGFALTLIGCSLAAVMVIVFLPAFALEAALAFVLVCLFGYFTGTLALASDVKKPKLDWLTETEAVKQKSGALIGMLLSWAVLGLLGVGSYFLLSAGASVYVYFFVLFALLLAAAVLGHRMLLKAADEKYCLNG